MTSSVDLTALHQAASSFAAQLQPGDVVYLQGPLGAGKTTFVQAVLASLGHPGSVKSPTYTLVESYDLPLASVYHFDLYRLQDPAELEFMGLRDYLSGHAICLFEWPDKGRGYMPKATWQITLAYDGEKRQLSIERSCV